MKKTIVFCISFLMLLLPEAWAKTSGNPLKTNDIQAPAVVNRSIVQAEDLAESGDSIFSGKIINKEYDVFIQYDFIKKNIIVPGQDVLGEVAGYIKYSKDSRVWLIMDVEIDRKKGICTMEIINDYGSEDLVATLSYDRKSRTFTFVNKHGSTIKFAKNNKWMKLPAKMIFSTAE